MMKLRINPLVVKDLKEIRDYIADDNVEKARETVEKIYSKFENIQLFPGMGAELSKRVSFRTDYKYAVCMKSDNIPVGYINVSMADHHDLGYGLRKEFWHRGIMTEAGKAVVNQVKADGLPYITATHDVKNPRSGAVMKRLGMVYQYSYEELWQPKNFLVTFRMYQLNLNGSTDRVYRKYWNDAKVHFVEVEPQE